ncbi:MAG: hypothetical protein JOZ66_01170, partial [Hyphomicrobiales bacterium]|nr:hypothetical protein [Hyphomicrobiales bacterium]
MARAAGAAPRQKFELGQNLEPRQSAGARQSADLTKAPASLLFVATDLLARAFAERIGRHNDLTLPEWRCTMVLARRPGLANIEVAEAS